MDDPALEDIFSVYRHAWLNQAAAKYPGVSLRIEVIKDPEYGDTGLRLVQDCV